MQMISGKNHFDTITLRQKKTQFENEGYNIRSVYTFSQQIINVLQEYILVSLDSINGLFVS